jgi:AcrR family transcriptional regulator
VESEARQPQRGLRERKKAKTKAAIQYHALRLFHQQGYDVTTVEQIAEAAEISPSTFFRYFPNKEDVVLYDDFDPLIYAAFEAQPSELNPLNALRCAFHEVFAHLPLTEKEKLRERANLVLAVPELRQRMLDQLVDAMQLMAELLAKRIGRSNNEFAVQVYVGAVMGTLLSAILSGAADPQADFIELMDASLAFLEAGLPL